MFPLVVKLPDYREPEKSRILKILTTSENQALNLSLLDQRNLAKPPPLLFYSVLHQTILHINSEPLGGKWLTESICPSLSLPDLLKSPPPPRPTPWLARQETGLERWADN